MCDNRAAKVQSHYTNTVLTHRLWLMSDVEPLLNSEIKSENQCSVNMHVAVLKTLEACVRL